MRLKTDEQAPKFIGETQTGDPISLDDFQGKTVFLKFFRYAGCPICNLSVQEYNQHSQELTQAGVTTLMVFHSSKELLNKNLKPNNSYTIIADPEKRIFDLYHVEKSWIGVVAPGIIPDYAKAIAKGFFSPKLFGNEGGDNGLPADFLIDGTGTIKVAHYGKHAADSLSAKDCLKIVQDLGLSKPKSQPLQRPSINPSS